MHKIVEKVVAIPPFPTVEPDIPADCFDPDLEAEYLTNEVATTVTNSIALPVVQLLELSGLGPIGHLCCQHIRCPIFQM